MRLPTLYRYIMREIAALFIAIIIILLAIILSFRLARLLSAAVAGDMSLSAVWQLIGLQAVNMLIILIPVALILAAVMTLSRLYSDQEMSAVFASGISRAHIHRIIFVSAAPVCALLLYLTLMIMPDVYRQSAAIRDQARQQASFALLSANSFRRLDNGISIHTGDFNAGAYQDFFIAQHGAGNNAVIFSDSGRIETRGTEHFLHLKQGTRIAWQDNHDMQEAGYTEFRAAELHLPSSESHRDERLRNLPTAELGTDSREHLAEWQTRLNPAVAMLIFCLCIPMLAHTGPRKGRQQKLLPAFLLFAIYSSALDNAVKAVTKGSLPALPGSFIVHAVVFTGIFCWWLKARKSL